ncbi:hypothetical protein [Planomicrobium sp. CPCC 101079]|uniref:hypothetical protein n=1 Tax=Planomicrobium sp. CPCC 101079 TaxID=2599618 RepID=UPI0011B40608|nr:hypothetical protein [Planomicrobium sp. CPCC 101079]TWT01496.1 hypothetical protein FQV28_15590 [Planomicrobium sp. CPCC 101079]
MPAKQMEADKLCLFILIILGVLALSGCGTEIPSEIPKPASSEVESQETNTADQAPNESVGIVPVLVDEEKNVVLSSKRLKVDMGASSKAQLQLAYNGANGYVIPEDSAIVYFMRDFNRLWDVYWVALWVKEDYFTLNDTRNLKALIVEYEGLRRVLQSSVSGGSSESAGFQEEFAFFGDLAIHYRIQAVQHVLASLESGGSKTSSEMTKKIERINEGLAWSNEEVEKMNIIYTDYLKMWSNSIARQRGDWADDFSQKYAYKADR